MEARFSNQVEPFCFSQIRRNYNNMESIRIKEMKYFPNRLLLLLLLTSNHFVGLYTKSSNVACCTDDKNNR